jgi:hypothetical protein
MPKALIRNATVVMARDTMVAGMRPGTSVFKTLVDVATRVFGGEKGISRLEYN